MVNYKRSRNLLMASLGLALSLGLAACQSQDADKKASSTSSADTSASATEASSGMDASIAKLFPGQQPLIMRESPIKGLQEIVIAGDVFYASPDGKYFMRGDILDVATMSSKTEETRNVLRGEAVKNIDVKDSITFKASGKEKHEIYVFTDTDCGYCRKFHEEIKSYTSKGITVHYFPWPRSGTQGPTYDTMVSVWCAKDKAKAMTDAKMGRNVPSATCENPVAEYVEVGRKMGINGTPAIFTTEGRQVGGYVPADDLLKSLEGQGQ
jgi:Protein-disulfide isomerase